MEGRAIARAAAKPTHLMALPDLAFFSLGILECSFENGGLKDRREEDAQQVDAQTPSTAVSFKAFEKRVKFIGLIQICIAMYQKT